MMDAEAKATDPETTRTSLTWMELARHIAAMTPEQRRRPVYVGDEVGHAVTAGLVLAEGHLHDKSLQLLHGDASVMAEGSICLIPSAPTADAPAHPADGLVMVALGLDDGEEPPADFETATGVYYALSEVEDVGEGRCMAWYFQQELPHPA